MNNKSAISPAQSSQRSVYEILSIRGIAQAAGSFRPVLGWRDKCFLFVSNGVNNPNSLLAGI